MKHLTDEQLNLELCKWLGWTEIDQRFPMLSGVGPDGNSGFLPDHINDMSSLGRIALIESKLTHAQAEKYARNLYNLDNGYESIRDYYGEINWFGLFQFASHSTRQRVTAILLTVNPEVFQ